MSVPEATGPASAAAAGLVVSGLRAGYGPLTVLHGIDFELAPGGVLAVVGPNGAGKSTLLTAIAGSLRLQSGQISYRGRRLERMPAFKRVPLGISLVPEGRQVFSSISVRANLDVTVFARGRSRADRVHLERREQLLEMFPVLGERQRQIAGTLSGGEQQMLAIARALMCAPSLLLLDEPMQGIAPAAAEMIAERLSALAGSMSIVVAEPEQTLPLVGRRITLRMGRLVGEHESGARQLEGGAGQLEGEAGQPADEEE